MIIFKNLIFKISSLRFAISLIIFIAISSSIGTFIPQGSNENFYIDIFDDAPILGFLNVEKVENFNWIIFIQAFGFYLH